MGERKRSKEWCGWFLVVIVGATIAFSIFVLVKKKEGHSDSEAAPVPGPPGAITKKYADALKVAMQFFDVQKGILVLNPYPLLFFLNIIWHF